MKNNEELLWMEKGGKFFIWEGTYVADSEAQKLNTVKRTIFVSKLKFMTASSLNMYKILKK